ncbi:hypothetical protein FN846DRAFT_770585 [Sphaerosporella brunnea]|uniref:Uncharacterized protein n=1 Tax=Sphaerosporella brunnea TaxID=1250544 RepID=A0A5J5FCD7_9PEZI|nr:hypothetical protein FN846DRAFT_770585 [Sphaerosporella brunnea]
MSTGVYYVFLKWASTNNAVEAANNGRFMLCFNSRFDADELFRAMQGLLMANRDPLFTVLDRRSPQFWCFTSPEGYGAFWNFQNRNELPQFKNVFSAILLNDLGGRDWPVIPNPIAGPDWVSGGEFFIRNRRQPSIYWCVYADDAHLYASDTRRTKFIVQTTASNLRNPAVMVRDDKVTIQTIPETIGNVACDCVSAYVAIGDPKGNSLTLSNVAYEWKFGGLLNKNVGVKWESDDTARLMHMPLRGGDEWELV